MNLMTVGAQKITDAALAAGRYPNLLDLQHQISPATGAGENIATLPPDPKNLLASVERCSRRRFHALIASAAFWPLAAKAQAAPSRELLITKSGAVADDSTVNTRAIQAAIDQLAAKGGGTVVVPKGIFVSGALFHRPLELPRATDPY
jgi:polygalacturonase